MRMRNVRPGECLAIDPSVLKQSRDAFFWLWAPPAPETEMCGNVAVVHIRGPLEHHADMGGDSYDAIRQRVDEAMCDEATEAVVLRIDSPGGVVSGLNETVYALQAMGKQYGKRLVAYIDEMATSAAYALACACDEIYLPASGIAGSIGVISTMADQTVADKKAGLRVVTITSGERKADGHPHVPITDDAIASETQRVRKLATQFFKIVSKSRGLSVASIDGFEAGIFLGNESVKAGIADAVMSFTEMLSGLQDEIALDVLPAASSTTERSVDIKKPHTAQGPKMSLAIAALIKKTTAAMAKEKDAKKRATLQAALEAYKKTKRSIEKLETEEGDEEDEEEEEKGNETDRGDKPEDDEGDDGDDGDDADDEDDEEEEEEEAAAEMDDTDGKKALVAMVQQATGTKGGRRMLGSLSALLDKAKKFDALNERVATIEKQARVAKKNAMIDEATAARAITKHEASKLRSKPLAFVEGVIDMRRDAKGRLRSIIHTDEDSILMPDGNGSAPVSAEAMNEFKRASMVSGISVEKLVEGYKKDQAAKNGTNGRTY